jgi:hypothetical protein
MVRIVVVGAGVVGLGAAMLLAGESIPADLVVDMTGRRSALPGWLQDIGARPPAEELEDRGFIYYGRHFRSADGSLPSLRASPLMHWDTISSLTLPADNGTWSVALVIGSKDTPSADCASQAAGRRWCAVFLRPRTGWRGPRSTTASR